MTLTESDFTTTTQRGGFNAQRFGGKYERNEQSFTEPKKVSNYEKKRISTYIDVVCKELLMNIVGFDRRKSLFKELTNSVELYSAVYELLGENIIDKTTYVEKAFQEIESFDITTINKNTGLENKRGSTKISKKSKQLLDNIVGFDKRKSIYKEVNKAVDLYVSVYQIVGDETPDKTKYILDTIAKYKNSQS